MHKQLIEAINLVHSLNERSMAESGVACFSVTTMGYESYEIKLFDTAIWDSASDSIREGLTLEQAILGNLDDFLDEIQFLGKVFGLESLEKKKPDADDKKTDDAK